MRCTWSPSGSSPTTWLQDWKARALPALTFSGLLTQSLADALGAQPQLRELHLCTQNHPDLSALSELRELRHVSWRNTSLTIAELEPLTHATGLQLIEFWGSGVPERDALEQVFARERFPELAVRLDGQ